MKKWMIQYLVINQSRKLTVKVLFATMLSALLSYYFMIVDGYAVVKFSDEPPRE